MSTLSPLRETILTACVDGPITAYDPYTGNVIARFSGGQCPRNGITVIGDNGFASSCVSPETGAGSIHLYYWWSTTCTHNIPLLEPVAPLVATADGLYLFSGGISGRIHSIMVPSGLLIGSFLAHDKPVSCIAINGDGSLIVSGSEDGTIVVTPILMLIDSCIDTESKSVRFVGHDLAVTGIATGMGRSDGIMISSSLDWTCKVWGVTNGTHLQTVKFPVEIWSMVLDPSETELYAAGTDGLIYKRNLKEEVAQGRETVVWGDIHDGAVVAMMMLNYGRMLLTISENGRMCAWDVDSGKMLSSFVEKIGGAISSVVVVKRGSGFGTRRLENEETSEYGGGKEIGKAVKEVAEMEEALKVVAEDRGHAISNLESAIEINEKLLNLMLKEADAISKLETIT